MQIEVVSARFNHGNTDYFFSPNGLKLKTGDKVIVDTEKGKDLVTITKANHEVDSKEIVDTLKNVMKIASEEDISLAKESAKKANALLGEVKAIVSSNGLEMKVVSVEANYNLSRLTVNFTAENS